MLSHKVVMLKVSLCFPIASRNFKHTELHRHQHPEMVWLVEIWTDCIREENATMPQIKTKGFLLTNKATIYPFLVKDMPGLGEGSRPLPSCFPSPFRKWNPSDKVKHLTLIWEVFSNSIFKEFFWKSFPMVGCVVSANSVLFFPPTVHPFQIFWPNHF